MNITIQVNRSDLTTMKDRVRRTMVEAKGEVQMRMAEEFRSCVLANFGGSERFVREPFAPLSYRYAQKVGRDYATLEVSGKLKGSIYVGINEQDEATVSVENSDVSYAVRHQVGGGGIPAR